MGHQLALAEVGARQIENRAQHRLRVRLTKLVGEPSIVIDVSDEQGNRTTRRARLGNRSRGGVDEGVVRREPSLLIEKNGILLQAGPSLPGPRCLCVEDKTTVRAKDRMTQGKRRDLCHIAFIQASFHALSQS